MSRTFPFPPIPFSFPSGRKNMKMRAVKVFSDRFRPFSPLRVPTVSWIQLGEEGGSVWRHGDREEGDGGVRGAGGGGGTLVVVPDN
jgi:hypothetical protein